MRRRWIHHRLVWRGRRPDVDDVDHTTWLGLPDFGDADDAFGCVGAIAVWLVVGLAVAGLLAFVFPALMLVLDVVLFVVVVGGGFVGKVVLRRPWTIEAAEIATSRAPAPSREWKVSGWKASNQAIDRIADHLAAGVEPAP